MFRFKWSASVVTLLIVLWVCCVNATPDSMVEDVDNLNDKAFKSFFSSQSLDPKEQEHTETFHSGRMPKTPKFKYISSDSEKLICIIDQDWDFYPMKDGWTLVPKHQQPDQFISAEKRKQFFSHDKDVLSMPNGRPRFPSTEEKRASSYDDSLYNPDYFFAAFWFVVGGIVCLLLTCGPVKICYQRHLSYQEKLFTYIVSRMENEGRLTDYVDVARFNVNVADQDNFIVRALLRDDDEWSELIDRVYKDKSDSDATRDGFSRHRDLVKLNQCQFYYIALQTALDDCKRRRDRAE